MAASNQQKNHRERLRLRMREGGFEAFHDYELLEYLLTFVHRQGDTKAIAKALIAEFGSFGAVFAASHAELVRVKGVGDKAAAAIHFVAASILQVLKEEASGRPVLSNWAAVEDYLKASMAHQPREQFRILFLDTKNVLIRDHVLSVGTVDQTAVHVRELVKAALETHASALIIVHNHPSGDPSPSRDDIRMTDLIKQALSPLGITLHDHIIVGSKGLYSFRANGLA
ncbi:MAG: DNA repair protein RadC [Pacificimonas sp.]|jgi:DNA repair protein RadC|nr:DNA repair protein RadC [Pacificimonas sp.]